MKRTFVQTKQDAPAVALGRRVSPEQQSMRDTFGNLGALGNPADQDLLNFSGGYPLGTMAAAAGSVAGMENPRVEAAALTVEIKTVFAAQDSELAALLGNNGICPLRLTDKTTFIVQSMQFNSHLPRARPLRGRVSVGTFQREQRSATLAPFGVGMEMPLRFYQDPDGPMIYRGALDQIAAGVIDFLLLLVYNVMESARDYGASTWKTSISGRARRDALRIDEWLERENLFLGVIQREEHPVETVMNFVKRQQQLIQTSSNAAMIPEIIADFMHHVRGYTEYFRAGPDGPTSVRLGGEQILSSRLGLTIHFVRKAVIDDEEEFDFMSGYRRYGEVVHMPCRMNEESDNNKYRTEWDSVEIYNGEIDEWCVVTKREALLYSGRWDVDPDDPVGPGPLRDMSNRNAGWVDTTYNGGDWLHSPGPRGNPYASWTQLPDQYLSQKDKAKLRRKATDAGISARIGAEEQIGWDIAKEGEDLRKLILNAYGKAQYTRQVDGWVAKNAKAETYSGQGEAELADLEVLFLNQRFATAWTNGYFNDATTLMTAALRQAIENALAEVGAGTITKGDFIELFPQVPPIYQLRSVASSSSSSSTMSDAAQISTAVGISKKAQDAVQASLTGKWSFNPSTGHLTPLSGVADAKLSQLGLLKQRDGKLDTTTSDPNAVALLSWVHNYGYNQTSNVEGVRNTEIARGNLLAAASALNTEGSASDVSARIGAFVNWAVQNKYVPSNVLSAPLTTPRSATEAAQIGKALSTFAAENTAVFVGSQLATALRSVAGIALKRDTAAIGAALQTTARIGAPFAADTSTGEATLFGYGRNQLNNYINLLESDTYTVQTAFWANQTSDTSATELRTATNAFFDSYRVWASNVQAASSVFTGPATGAGGLTAGVALSTNWEAVEKMLEKDVPVPVDVLLFRPEIILRTSGIIMTQTGAQNAYYAHPIMTWTTDDAHQVERGTLSFEAGAFIRNDRPTYHARDLLITGCLSGFNCDFFTGGSGDRSYKKSQEDTMTDRLSAYQQRRPSIIAVVEPMYKPGKDRLPSPMTVYGKYGDLNGLPFVPADAEKPHYASADFVRMWFGVSAKNQTQLDEATAAYMGSESAPDSMLMYHGGYRRMNTLTNRFEERYISGTGPIAGNTRFYGKGMTTAWRNNTPYPASSTTMVLAN